MKPKILLWALIVFVLSLTLASCSEADPQTVPEITSDERVTENRYSISKLDGYYKTQGRTIINDNGLALLGSADSFEFNADCQGDVCVNLIAETTEFSGEVDVYFTGYVDGERCETRYHIGNDGKHELILATGLKKGAHSFKIVRQTDWNHGDVYVTGIRINGTPTDPPEKKDLYIEFIGDSLTTGFGNLPDVVDDAEWGGAPVYQDATLAYPYLVSEALGADFSVVAVQGIGAACCGHPFTMNEVYLSYPRISEGDYLYEESRPVDIVVINMLANDAVYVHKTETTDEEVIAKAKQLCEQAKETHPDALIVFAPAAFGNRIKAMVENELGGAEKGYYVAEIPMDRKGKASHPSAEGHKNGAETLISYLEELIKKNGLR